ncbi:ZNF91 [Branchiostoma lanceolatum]|uniref:ZNF91 protein n=1 Tax=Branchiostoma lanceolatum TaxID=7740 RepID=A0A8J9ZAQ0_BRALA|nr:ZNF91 [Branchiostoma lanceolatum]
MDVDTLPMLNTLPASCSTFESAEVTVEFSIEEVDQTQYTIESSSSGDDIDGDYGDDDGIADAAVPVSVTVSKNFGWSVSSKDDETAKNTSERNDRPDLTVHDETSLQKNSESKQVFVSQDEDHTPNRKTLKRASTGDDKLFKCGECSYSTFRKGDLARHEIKHTGDMPFKCDECSYGTVRKSDLEKHKIVHTKTFSCELCDYKTPYKSGFSRHLMKDHGQSSDQVGLKKDGTRIKVFKCEECSFSARKKTELALHERKHTSKKPFTCDQCDYSTPRKSDLVLHKTRHTGDMPFKCDECSYATTRKSSLVRHKMTHSSAENIDQAGGMKDSTRNKPFKCTECSYSTGRKRELARHNLKHTGNFPYKCDQCDYGTLRKSDLESHKVRHTGDMPFKCTECDYGTGRRPDFDRHSRTHTGQKPFKCGICSFRSAIECNLLRHQQKRHKGCKDLPSIAHDVPNEKDNVDKLFKCKECEYSSASKTDLVEHTTSHGSGKSSILDKTGADKSDLTAEDLETVNNSEADTNNELSDITSLPADCPLNPERLEEMSKSSEVLGSSEVETSVETEMLTSNQVDQTDSVINNEGTKSTEEAVSSLKEDDEAQEPGTSESDHDTETTESNFTKSFQRQISQGHDSGKAAILEDSQSKDEDFLRSRSTEGLEQDVRVDKPFKCGECGFSAHRKKDLECHKRTHTGNIFKCAECDYEATRKSDLVKHMVMHTGDLPHKCDQCSYSSLRKSEIARHKVVHTGKKPFSCLQCDFKSAYKQGLVKHIKLYHSSKVGSPKNNVKSDKEESSKGRLDIEQLETEDNNCVSDGDTDDTTAITGATDSTLSEKVVDTSEGLIQIKSADDNQSKDKESTSSSLKKAAKTKGKPRSTNLYLCETCDYSTHRKDCLVRHMIIHSGAKPYNCKQCEYRAADKSNLIKHIRKHLNVKKQYRCKNCDYTTTVRAEFLVHKMNYHVKMHSCKECSYTSNRSTDIVRHMKTHTGEKPYLCDECGFRSADKSNLQKHKQKNHQSRVCDACGYTTTKKAQMNRHSKIHRARRPTNDPEYRSALCGNKSKTQYICEECGYITNTAARMKDHTKSHTLDCPYVCGECGYRTPHKWNLAKHKLGHVGVKPFCCDVCGYQTARAGDLRRHERTHTGEKPYMCGVCDFRSGDSSSLSKHIATIHSAKRMKFS